LIFFPRVRNFGTKFTHRLAKPAVIGNYKHLTPAAWYVMLRL